MSTPKKGERVIAYCEGRRVEAVVTLVSPNGRSLVIEWDDGMLAGYAGKMPIWREEDGRYVDLLSRNEIILIGITDEPEEADFIVCAREGTPSPFRDNLIDVCSHCGQRIIFRPNVPQGPPKICMECAVELTEATRQ